MFLRFITSPGGLLVRAAFVIAFSWHGSETAAPTLEIAYAPETVFRGDPATFQVNVPKGGTLTVTSNTVTTLEKKGDGSTQEYSCFPQDSLALGFSDGRKTVTFQFRMPGERGPLTERDGFLVSEDQPVVLLPDHRKPPPLDRRWETGRFLREVFATPPALTNWICLLPERDARDLTPFFSQVSTTSPTMGPPDSSAWFRVHGMILALPLQNAPFVVTGVDTHDLERGIPPGNLIMKWQFALQALQDRTGYTDGLLIGPILDQTEQKQFSGFIDALRSLARAHDLRFVDRSLPREEWQARILHALEKEYTLP